MSSHKNKFKRTLMRAAAILLCLTAYSSLPKPGPARTTEPMLQHD